MEPRSASANSMLSDAKRRILAMLSRQNRDGIIRPPFGGECRGTRLHGKADVGEIAKEELVNSDLECQPSTSTSNMFQAERSLTRVSSHGHGCST